MHNTVVTTITVGVPVLSSDDEKLGAVKEIRGTLFKVDAPLALDYWLECGCIVNNGLNAVRTNFTKAELDDHKRPEPEDD